MMIGFQPSKFWRVCWAFVTPTILTVSKNCWCLFVCTFCCCFVGWWDSPQCCWSLSLLVPNAGTAYCGIAAWFGYSGCVYSMCVCVCVYIEREWHSPFLFLGSAREKCVFSTLYAFGKSFMEISVTAALQSRSYFFSETEICMPLITSITPFGVSPCLRQGTRASPRHAVPVAEQDSRWRQRPARSGTAASSSSSSSSFPSSFSSSSFPGLPALLPACL